MFKTKQQPTANRQPKQRIGNDTVSVHVKISGSRRLAVRCLPFPVPGSRLPVLAVVGWLLAVPCSLLNAARVTAVDSVSMSVADLNRSIDFYTKVLPFRVVDEGEVFGREVEERYQVFGVRVRTARLRLGDEFINLHQFLAPEGRPVPIDSRSNDRWFQHFAIIVSDMDKAYAVLRKNNVRHASSGPQTLPLSNKNAGGIKAFYFKDPDGHPVEILQFPGDKGDPKWKDKASGGALFLGIDHTAIVVKSTDESLHFYRDRLGMTVKGESENYGTEQEHLNNVRSARLRITGLRGAQGPGVEFLEYLSPKDGRAYPGDIQANDLVYTITEIVVDDITQLCPQVKPPARDCLIEDPDGHGIHIMKETGR